MDSSGWPARREIKALICAYFLVCLTILTILCTLRISSVGSWRKFKRISLARQVIVLCLLDSLLFTMASAEVLFGIGSSLSRVTCELGIWWCILLYASSKVMIYLFLMERLRIVHAEAIQDVVTLKERFASWWYRGAAVLLLCWIAVAIVMCIGRNAVLRENGECKIGLKLYSTVPMLTVDAVVNIYLTVGFLTPVLHAGFARAKELVKQSCIAAVAALVTSFANILILAIMHGHQMSYICLASCVFDVSANAAILWFITRHGDRESSGPATIADERRWSGTTYRGPSPVSRKNSTCYFGEPRPIARRGSVFEGVNVCRSQITAVDVPDVDAHTLSLGRLEAGARFEQLESPLEEKEVEEVLDKSDKSVATPTLPMRAQHHW